MSHLIEKNIRPVGQKDFMYLDVLVTETGKMTLTRPGDWIIFDPKLDGIKIMSDEMFRQQYEKKVR